MAAAPRGRQSMTSTRLADLEWSLARPLRPPDDPCATVRAAAHRKYAHQLPPPRVPQRPCPRPQVTLHNVVATANFGVPIKLERLAWAYYGEYNPRTFAAVHLRLREPKTTARVFSSGRIVCTGSPSEHAALAALNIYLHMVRPGVYPSNARACARCGAPRAASTYTTLTRRCASHAYTTSPPARAQHAEAALGRRHQVQSLQPEARMVTQTIQNIVSVGYLGAPVRIDALARALVLRSAYDPEIFPCAPTPVAPAPIAPVAAKNSVQPFLPAAGGCA